MENIKVKEAKENAGMSGKYLDPKADLTFKLVFGEHPDLVMSLLNALLPLADDGQITSVEYMTPEMVPENPGKKDSVVDVRCIDEKGRQFIVEMQLYWNEFFQQRVLLNASKAVVRQLNKGEDYNLMTSSTTTTPSLMWNIPTASSRVFDLYSWSCRSSSQRQ